MVRTRRSGSDRAAFLDAAILTTGIAVPAAVFVIAPMTADSSLSTLGKVVASAYPLGDVFLLAALARLITSAGARNSSYRLLMSALVVTTVTDVAWNVLVAMSRQTRRPEPGADRDGEGSARTDPLRPDACHR
jgi:hypothetical protein